MVRLTKVGFSWSAGMDEPEFPESEVWVNPLAVAYVEHEDYIWIRTETVHPRTVIHFIDGMSLAVKESVEDVVRKLVGGGVRAIERCGAARDTFGQTIRCTLPEKHDGAHVFDEAVTQ